MVEAPDAGGGPLSNDVGQCYNHTFFWNNLSSTGDGEPNGDIAAKNAENFGSVTAFKAEFMAGGVSQFSSVWFGLVWFGLVWFGLVWFGWSLTAENLKSSKQQMQPTTYRWVDANSGDRPLGASLLPRLPKSSPEFPSIISRQSCKLEFCEQKPFKSLNF